MSSWKTTVQNAGAAITRANNVGDFSKLKEGANKLSADELQKRGDDFPELKMVIEELGTFHSGLTEEFRAVTDDLAARQADKPTAIERVQVKNESVTAASLANVNASTARVTALIELLPDGQQQQAAEYWEALLYTFGAKWGDVRGQTGHIFEVVIEWQSQVWEQVKTAWEQVNSIWSQFWDAIQQ